MIFYIIKFLYNICNFQADTCHSTVIRFNSIGSNTLFDSHDFSQSLALDTLSPSQLFNMPSSNTTKTTDSYTVKPSAVVMSTSDHRAVQYQDDMFASDEEFYTDTGENDAGWDNPVIHESDNLDLSYDDVTTFAFAAMKLGQGFETDLYDDIPDLRYSLDNKTTHSQHVTFETELSATRNYIRNNTQTTVIATAPVPSTALEVLSTVPRTPFTLLADRLATEPQHTLSRSQQAMRQSLQFSPDARMLAHAERYV